MTVVEFGQCNPDVILLLHGGGLSWWNHREAALLLADRYRVVLPVLDGHAGSDAAFTTIRENASRLIDWIDRQYGGEVLAVGGLSLGGQIAAEMLSLRPDICRYALLESTLIRPMKLTHALIGPAFGMSYGLIRQRWFARMQAAYLGIPETLFEDYYRDSCAIAKGDMIAFLKANSSYTPDPGLGKTEAKVTVAAGSREQKSIRCSAAALHQLIPGSRLVLLNGMRHGELSLNHPQRYVQILRQLIEEP